MNNRKIYPKTHWHAMLKSKRRDPQLRTLAGCVRCVELTPLGHLSCVLDTPAGRVKALSDAPNVHLPALRPGYAARVVLLRLRRETPDGSWDWQLLACQGVDQPEIAETNVHFEWTPI